MSTFVSYLKNLKFDRKLENTLHARYMRNIRLILLILFVILAVGFASVTTLPRRLNPEIKLTIVSVATVLPGAGPQDIESLITVPLEDKIKAVKNIDTMTSVSQENVSIITIQFLSNVDKDRARTDVQNAVNNAINLPTDAQKPRVDAFDFENQPIWTFSLVSNGDTASLMRFSDTLKNKIEDQPRVDHVALSGFNTQEIQIIMDQNKIREYGFNPLVVSQAISNATKSYPAGSVDTGASTLSLEIENQAVTIEDIRNITLSIEGQPLRLGDIAKVVEKGKLNQQENYLITPHGKPTQTVTFSVFKTSAADIDKTVTEVESFVNKQIDATSGRFQLRTINNSGEEISKQFTDLIGEFESTLILVFINLFLFLGLRQALIAMLTIPLTFLLSFTWMNLLGQSINFLTLFALLLAFGTSIDDTIVTVSAMTTYYRTKKFTARETGLLVWRDFIVPIWTTTVTTVWAFLPLILSTGIIGEFIKPIPIVVAVTMYSSTFIAWFITLPLMVILLKLEIPKRVKFLIGLIGFLALFAIIFSIAPKNVVLIPILVVFIVLLVVTYRIRTALSQRIHTFIKKNSKLNRTSQFVQKSIAHGVINTEPLGRRYRTLIARILGSRKGRRITMICLLIFTFTSYLLVPLGLVKNEFFPKTNTNSLFINFEMPAGTDFATLKSQTLKLLNDVKTTPQLEAALAQTGSAMSGGFGGGGDQSNVSEITLLLTPKEKRKITSIDLAESLRKKYEHYTDGKVSILEESGGPPAGSDIQIKFLGEDLTTLDGLANKTIAYLKKQPGTNNVDKSIKGGTSRIVFVPDKAKLASAGITLDNVGLWLRTYASGFTLDQIKINDTDEDIVFYTSDNSQNPQTLGTISIATPTGAVPLTNLGTFILKNNPTSITREGGKRTISVSAGVDAGYAIPDINKKLENFANTDLHLPDGYTWQTGGVNEENQKSVNSIFQAMGLSFLLIMATMVIEFSSYRQAAMILSLIPIAISGVFIVFGLTGTPLSFPALIGVLALFGVVVTNAMFIVEKINQNRKNGMPLINAIADAAESRLEPIMLTSLTSILGLVPITIANPLWRGLGGAIISGLMFSGLIMLFYIPVMYYLIYRGKNEAKK